MTDKGQIVAGLGTVAGLLSACADLPADTRAWSVNEARFAQVTIELARDAAEALAQIVERGHGAETAAEMFAGLTDEERHDLMAGYCRSCGCDDPSCRCWDDS